MVWDAPPWGPDHLESPFRGRSLPGEKHGDLCNLPIPYDATVVHLPPWFYEWWLAERTDAAMAGMMAWEADAAPADWRPVLDALDLVLVPSEFNRAVLRESGITTPVEVLPHIARPVCPVPGGAYGPVDDRDFVFYTIGPWSTRRAVGDTIRAFLDAFTAEDEVALVVKTSQRDFQAVAALRKDGAKKVGPYDDLVLLSVARIMAAYPHPPKVFVIAEEVPPALVDQLHTRGDCYVSLNRGEGWGLGSFDAVLFGNPAIVTGWGGVLEYLGRDWPLLVDYELVPTSDDIPDDLVELTDEMCWAKADRGHASTLMRWVYEHRQQAVDLANDLRPVLTSRYDSARVTQQLIDALGRVCRGRY